MDPQITCFLLLQLLNTWRPDVMAPAGRRPTVLSKTQKIQTPPIIAVLARLADAHATAHEPEGKELRCGHRIDVRSILTSSNLFADQAWRKGPHFLECPHPGCDTQYPLPMIPNPWVVDGLQARLDMISWAWAHSKSAPNHADVKIVRVLRNLLKQIGHLPRQLEMTSSSSWSGPGHRRLKQTLGLFDTEGVAGAEGKIYTGPMSLRGTKPYCSFRPSKTPFKSPSPVQYCNCAKPHERIRKPREWASTPAEDEEAWEYAIPRIENARKTEKFRQKKTVRFAAPVITDIKYFEPWWCNEYRYSNRYYSIGPCRTSTDRSTQEDDNREIARLDAEALAAKELKTKRRS